MASSAHAYDLAVVVIFAMLAIPTAFVLFRHGFKGMAIIGWGYLFVFCTLKLIGSGMQLSGSKGSGASTISSIGLSPLLLAAAGILHEAKFYTVSGRRNAKTNNITALLFHIYILAGLALIASGVSQLSKPGADTKTGWVEAKVGAVIMLTAWMWLVFMAVQAYMAGVLSNLGDPRRSGSARLLLAVFLALPFIGIRVIGTVAYLFSENQSLSAAGGSLGVKVGLYLIQELLATSALVAGGIVTRNIKHSDEYERGGMGMGMDNNNASRASAPLHENSAYEPMRQ